MDNVEYILLGDLSILSKIGRDKVIFYDIETSGLDPYTSEVLLIQIRSGSVNYIINTKLFSKEYIKQHLDGVLSRNVVVGHGIAFDWKMTYHHYGIYINNPRCTMIGEQLILAGLRSFSFGLDDVVSRRLGVELDKSVRLDFTDKSLKLSDIHYKYAALDVEVLESIYLQQMDDIKAQELDTVYELEMSIIPITAQMELNGVLVDVEKLYKAIPVVTDIVDKADHSIQDIVISNGCAESILFAKDRYIAAKISSSQQMLSVFNSMGIRVRSTGSDVLSEWDNKYGKKAAKKVNAGFVDTFGYEYNHPLIALKSAHSASYKLLSSYYNAIPQRINPVTKRLHSSFKQCGAVATGRYSSDIQQIPNNFKLKPLGLEEHSIRGAFIAPPGKKIVAADFGGQEMGVLALFSGDQKLIEKMLEGDVHSYVARGLFNVPEEEWSRKKDPYATMRKVAKIFSFGLAYGSTAGNFFRTFYSDLSNIGIHIELSDCERWIRVWMNELFPDVGKFLDESSRSAVTKYYTMSISGRKRYWSDEIRKDRWKVMAAEREGRNMPIQSSSADITKYAMYLVYHALDKSRAKIIMTVHDEIVLEVEDSYTEECLQIVSNNMEQSVKYWFPNAPDGIITVEPSVSQYYDK